MNASELLTLKSLYEFLFLHEKHLPFYTFTHADNEFATCLRAQVRKLCACAMRAGNPLSHILATPLQRHTEQNNYCNPRCPCAARVNYAASDNLSESVIRRVMLRSSRRANVIIGPPPCPKTRAVKYITRRRMHGIFGERERANWCGVEHPISAANQCY